MNKAVVTYIRQALDHRLASPPMRAELVARLAYGVALRLAQWDAPVFVMELAPPTLRRALPLGVVVTNISRC